MAKRFGGAHSPQPMDSSGAPVAVPRSTEVGRTSALFMLSLLYAVNAFRGDPRAMILGLSAAAVLMAAAWLTREGARAQDAYDARKVAKRPAFPRKIFAAVLWGVGLALGGMISQTTILYPLLFAVAGAALHLAAFGPDPLRDKGMEGIDSFQVERVARAVTEGEGLLAGMSDAILRSRDAGLQQRVAQFTQIARGLFRQVENDPADLTGARKFLTVYLMGARDATAKFADAYVQAPSPKLRSDYEALLTDLETTFAERTKALLSNDHTDVNVEIEVLRERLALET